MYTVSIEWLNIKYDKLSSYEDAYFYMSLKGRTLLYIGIAFKQDIVKEVNNTLRAFKVKGDTITIGLGYISYTTYKRITEQIVKDVECLLIFKNQPLWNTQCKSSYTGRPDLKVISHFCPLLYHIITARKTI